MSQAVRDSYRGGTLAACCRIDRHLVTTAQSLICPLLLYRLRTPVRKPRIRIHRSTHRWMMLLEHDNAFDKDIQHLRIASIQSTGAYDNGKLRRDHSRLSCTAD